MAFTDNSIINFGAYIPLNYLFDPSQLRDIKVDSPEFKEFLVRLYQNVNNMIQVLNIKDTGYYLTQPFQTGQLFFNVNNDFNNLRPIFRTVVNFGALPDTTTKSVAHGIPQYASIVKIITTATNPSGYSLPLPGFDPSDITKPINVYMDSSKVYIQTTSNMSAYTICWVIIEYIQT